MFHIDLNSDLGESFGHYHIGNDQAVIPLITSCNVACGWHAGDASIMRKTVAIARDCGISVGAHPGYPDLQGFGRRQMSISPEEGYDAIVYQVGALMAVCRTQGVQLKHVKPHGAFYNRCAVDRELSDAVVAAVNDLDPALIVVGLAGSRLVDAARDAGMRVAQEYFVDRNYTDDGELVNRREPDALITDEAVAIERAIKAITEGEVISRTGKVIEITADTICIHGDGEKALRFARDIREAFGQAGIDIRPL